MTRVSVVIPTFNRAKLVQESIESVLCQTLEDVEIIVVDDGSTDGTGQMLRGRYGDRIRYFSQENRGRSVARNLGIAAAAGCYLLFLDSDDLLLPGAAAQEAAYLDAHPQVDVVYADGYFCDGSGKDFGRVAAARPPHDPGDLLKDLVLSNVILVPHSVMLRRAALEAIGPPYFDPLLWGTEDENLWIRLAAAGKTFAYLDAVTCKYRVHGSNASRYDPSSPAYWERQKSVKRSRFLILDADYFARLPTGIRERFFSHLLLLLEGDEPARERALCSPRFAELPAAAQARLLYRLGVANVVDEHNPALGRRRLEHAARLDPTRQKYTVALRLAYLGRPTLAAVVTMWRLLKRARSTNSTGSPFGPHGLRPLV